MGQLKLSLCGGFANIYFGIRGTNKCNGDVRILHDSRYFEVKSWFHIKRVVTRKQNKYLKMSVVYIITDYVNAPTVILSCWSFPYICKQLVYKNSSYSN